MQSTTNIIDKNWKALIKPNKLEIKSNEDRTVANVIAEPLEKGFGQTIGNSLRRILLSSIETGVRPRLETGDVEDIVNLTVFR